MKAVKNKNQIAAQNLNNVIPFPACNDQNHLREILLILELRTVKSLTEETYRKLTKSFIK